MKRLDIEDRHQPIDVVLLNIDKAWDMYRTVRKNAPNIRADFMDGLIEAQAEAQNITKSAALKNIKHREAQRTSAMTLKYVLQRLRGAGTSIVIVMRNGEEIELTSREEIEQALLLEHARKYHQIENFCPLLFGELLRDIGLLGDGPHVDNILNGLYIIPDEADDGTRLYLQSLVRPATFRPSTHQYGLEDFKTSWKRTKERTSSHGPAHFGHYKAGCTHTDIAKVHYHMAEIPFISGYSPERHRKGTDVVLVKSKNDFRIQKLRTIVLFDAECNMNNGRIGRAAMRTAIDNNMIAPEQYSRPNRRAIDHALNRRLTFDYFAYLKKPHGMTSCDLAGCYDRIVHSAMAMALQRVGIAKETVTSMCDTLQRMIHVVRTAFGDSDDTYGGEENGSYKFPCMGSFQGNKAASQIWSIISSTIFDALRKKGFGVNFCTAISQVTLMWMTQI